MQFTTCWFAGRPLLAAAILFLVLPAGLIASPGDEQSSKSSAAARELAAALDAAKLDSIAAADPAVPGAWIAALYFKDGQLLVVSANYIAPTLLDEKAKTKQFRDIYIDLNSASVPGSKVFIQDMGADGLVFKPENDGAADTWEEKDKTLAFDGEWRKSKLSEEEYQKRFADADTRYTRMLLLLTAQAKGTSGS
jgi:hypothetical protein